MTETTAERYFDTLFYNIQEIQFRTAHLDIRTKTMQYLLIAILTVCTVHLVLFVVKWIVDARNQRKANRTQQQAKAESKPAEQID